MSSQADPSASANPSLGLPKVAIPRLRRPGQGQNIPKNIRRVPRACTACRTHKVKCTGERPHCRYCSSTNRECVYVMPRRDRLKLLTERCQQMATLLRELKPSVNRENNAKISDILEAVEEDAVQIRQSTASPSPSNDISTIATSSGVYRQEELPTEYLDLMDENLRQSDAPTPGFVGQNSDVQWLYTAVLAHKRRQDELGCGILPLQREAPTWDDEKRASFIYWTDDEIVDLDFFAHQDELPPPETAQRLFECYMLKVHDSFPILAREVFEDQFQRHFAAVRKGNTPRLNPGWQAILNMVFAIGAKYSHLAQTDWRADERDHLLYQARARTFGLGESTLSTHPDMPRVQSLGLLSFYWLSVGQVSRAWTVIGLALRFAYSLGLHVQNEEPSIGEGRREALVRTWWSMYSLERTLCIVTGRPSIINDLHCSVPLPFSAPKENVADDLETLYQLQQKGSKRPVSEGPALSQAKSGLYFRASVQLSMITQEILTSLYSANTIIQSSGEVQQEMARLSQRLDQWMMSLPVEFNVLQTHTVANHTFQRERSLLGFQLCSARMLLARPCMSEQGQAYQEEGEANFAKQMASSCVEAALTMIEFWPNEPHPEFVYGQYPWWCIVHYMMQAISVLLLGLAYPLSTSQDSSTLVRQLRRSIHWLRTLSDPVAKRAYRVAVHSFGSVVGRYPEDDIDLWTSGNFSNIGLEGQNLHSGASSLGVAPFMASPFDPSHRPPDTYPAFPTQEEGNVIRASDTYSADGEPSMLNAPYYTNKF